MTGPLLILGPQHPRPNFPAVLAAAGVQGPVAVVSAGWRHDEAELDALRAAIDQPVVPVPLYAWFDELASEAPALSADWHARQSRIRAFKQAYEIEMRAAIEVAARLERQASHDPQVQAEEVAFTREAVRALDRRALQRLDEIRDAFPRTARPWEEPAAARRHHEARHRLQDCAALCIAGGHVAVLLNRIVFFGVDDLARAMLARGGAVVAWSAGAMVLTERIVLYYDDPPEGTGDPEVLDRGLGLVTGHVLFPHARRRLDLHDRDRVHRLATRLHPARCLSLENGAALVWQDGTLVDQGSPESCCELGLDGEVRPLRPRSDDAPTAGEDGL